MVGNENFSLNLQNDENEQFNLEMQNEDTEIFTVGFGEVTNIGGGGVHDGQLANDAATVGQINATIDAINTALNTNIPHVGA